MKLKRLLFIFLLIYFSRETAAQEYIFASLQGETSINTEGWNLTGNAFVGNTGGTSDNFNNEIILTTPGNFQSGGIFFQEAIDLSICSNWIVEFDFRIWDGNAADGLAFCFLDVPPTGFVDGAGMGIPETANGLKVVIDTFDNCGGPNPELQIYSGVGYHECAPGIFKLENTTGQLAFIRNNQYRSARITYDEGLVEFFINDVLYLSGFAPANFEGFMGFTASTGGFNDRHSIKNVTIYTLSAESEAGEDITICSGQNIEIGSEPNPDYVYVWSPAEYLSDINIANPEFSFENNTDQIQSFTYFVTTSIAENPGVCETQDSIVINVLPNLGFSFDSPSEVCKGSEVSFTPFIENNLNNLNYLWSFEGGEPSQSQAENPSGIIWEETGIFEVTLQTIIGECSLPPVTQQIIILEPPLAVFSFDELICEGNQITFNLNNDNPGLFEVSWFFEGGLPATSENELSPVVSFLSPGIFSVTAIVSNEICSATQIDSLQVIELPTALFEGPDTLCINNEGFFNYTGSADSSASYNWFFDEANITTIEEQGPVTNFWTQDGVFEVSLIVESNGCESLPYSNTIVIKPAVIPVVDFYGVGTSACVPFTTEVFNSSESFGESVQLQWYLNNSLVGLTENLLLNIEHSGNYDLKLIVTTTTGCIGSDSLELINFIEGYPIPNSKILVEPSERQEITNPIFLISTEEEHHFCTFQLPNDIIYNCQTQFNAPESGVFPVSVIVENEFGCLSESAVNLHVEGILIFVPNSFSPNGDGVNDIFKPNIIGVKEYTLQVFDRWGKVIFETNNIEEGWNGKEADQNAVYVYKILVTDFFDNVTLKNGTIQVLK